MMVDILNNTSFNLEQKYIDIINNVVKKSLEIKKFSFEPEVSISIVNNEQIRRLNYEHRGIDNETDVLSFPMFTFKTHSDVDLFNSQMESSLGDIVISIEKAVSQASEYEHTLEREIAFLTAHSMLHLLGYDHETYDDEELMFSITEKMLDELGYVR